MKLIIKSFQELTTLEVYAILRLRSEVFVVEQDCVYQDIDDKDQKAIHLFGVKNNKIIGYTRIFKAGDYFKKVSIGRVVIAKRERKFNYGHQLMEASIQAIKEHFKESSIEISAQEYLQKFYEFHKFKKVGNGYLEDGIPHIKMIRNE